LLATDLSCRCDRALDRAIRLAAEWNAELVAAYVVEPSKSLEYSLERSRPLFRRRPDPVDRMRWRLKRDVASAADNIRTIVEKGEAADTLLAIADREACDLIVTGVARDEALGRIFFGGTVDRLVRRSTVPVLVVRDRPVRAYRDIVVATDFSEASLQALSAAATLFPQGRLTLFHACDVPFAGLIQDRDFEAELREMEKALGERQAEMRKAAQAELAIFADEARRAGLAHDGQAVTIIDGSFQTVVEHARLRGLTIAPFVADDAARADLIQALIFESGRPVLVLPQEGEGFRLERIALAWDFGRAAARAVADAMPLLRQAREVRILTVLSDKQAPASASGPELTAHLARNGVHATFIELERGRRPVGEVLEEGAEDADLMVMGAFGHSRLRDFFLGGATRHVLDNPRRPTLLSH